MSLRDTLKGTGVALITPFNNKQQVDFDALGRVIDFVIHNGVEYLVVLGTTAETPTLEKSEKLDIVQYTYQRIGQAVPIVVGIGGNNTKETVAELEAFPLQHAEAVLSASPYYNRPSQQGIFNHYQALAEASPKPVILYNVPGRTGSNISAQTTIQLAHECPNIMGIKEASGNVVQCLQILKDRPSEFLVTSGDDHLALSLIAAGMDGVISVAANGFPRDFSEMVRLALSDQFQTARHLLYKLLDAFDLMFVENNPAGIKAIMSELGLIENYVRLPLTPLSSQYHKSVQQYISIAQQQVQAG